MNSQPVAKVVKRPAKRGRKPKNAATNSADSILRGLLENRSSKAYNSPLFEGGFGSRSPGSSGSGSMASPDCSGRGFLNMGTSASGEMSIGLDDAGGQDHVALANFYTSFLGHQLSGDVSHKVTQN